MNAAISKATKILVVDDTATNRQILAAFLKKLGFAVIRDDAPPSTSNASRNVRTKETT